MKKRSSQDIIRSGAGLRRRRRVHAARGRRGKRLAAVARDIDNWLAAAPRTLIHGDLKGGNIFMRKHDAYVIDWQWCGWGCGVHDVVYYLATTGDVRQTAGDYAHALWLYHHALVNEVGPELRKERPWPFPDTHRLFMLALLDYIVGRGPIGSWTRNLYIGSGRREKWMSIVVHTAGRSSGSRCSATLRRHFYWARKDGSGGDGAGAWTTE